MYATLRVPVDGRVAPIELAKKLNNSRTAEEITKH